MSDQKASEVEDLEHIYADASKGPVQISYGVLNSITKSFSQVIGHGASSVVYLGDLKNGKVAVKKVSQTVMDLSDIRFLEEVKCLKRVKHQNIVRFLGYCAESHGVAMEIDGKFRLAEVPQRLLCFEYVPNGTLHDYLHQEKTYGFEWNIRYQIIKGICAGLHYLHQGRICHLDLKPGNVLLGTHMEPKITDFGLSRCIDEQSTIDTIHIFGTPGYIAPELINNQKISFKSDIFSLGKIMDRLLIGSNGSTTEDWHEGLNTDCQQMKRCIDVAKHCVEDNPSKRPTIADIVLKLNETDSCRPLKDYYIPDYILKPDSEQVTFDSVPLCPVVVFINSRSGGQLGSSLIKTYRELLNEAQVFDLSEEAPDKVLHRLYCNFEKLKSNGDLVATQIQRSLRLIVAGGDGTASWLLGVVSDLKLSHPPPVATVPLGTENNLPFSFGWGKKNPATDQAAVKSFLGQVKRAGEMKIDSWHIIMRMRIAEEVQCDHIAPLDLPHSLHAFRHVSACEYLNLEGYHTFRGGFWNYFSMGLDAQVSYEFHSERKRNQEKFRPQLRNQSTYAKFGFSHLLRQPSSWNIAQLAEVKIMKRPGGLWEELEIPCSIQSVVCLNLPSFSGGLNPWGIPSTRNIRDRELTAPFVDDGLIEVVGFGNAWHRLKLLAPNGHGTRLAQAHRIRFEFQKGAAEHTFMRIDGEPWKQPLPKDDDTVVIEISNFRQVAMLTNDPCRSKSIMDPSSPSCHSNSLEDEDDSNSLEDEDEWEHGDP